ncbi:hypothetical protein FG379_000550 [Cryptosporidium bovis]|uniref:uncharacterized protein n=1 Tax=Cryptosporidium bovis TaxID=310047 RepID=UPI00351AAFF4|nr:hypothetical protein FG379_000550 [Cryptosporidium bovis]
MRSKRIKFKSEKEPDISRHIEKKQRVELESDSTASDVDEFVKELYKNNDDLYSKWTQFIESDKKNDFGTEVGNDNEEVKKQISNTNYGEKEKIGNKKTNPSENTRNKKTIKEIEDYYFKDYTNLGMLDLSRGIDCHKEDRNNEYISDIIKLPGFLTYKLEDRIKTDRMYRVEGNILESNGIDFEKVRLESYSLENNLRQNWLKHISSLKQLDSKEIEKLNTFYGCISGYLDVEYSDITSIISPWTLSLCMLHISKHIYYSRKLITDNNAKLQEALKNKDEFNIDFLGEDSMRDQGLSRCRVLILCPFKGIAKVVVETLINLLPHGKVLRGYDRFKDDFDADEERTNKSDKEIAETKNKDKIDHRKNVEEEIGRNDELYRCLFDGKDNEDEFKLGIQLTKSGINMYSSFDNSDIILASPLGLRMAIGNNEDSSGTGILLSLSSIELCLVYGGDIINMQNWDHLLDVFNMMNRIPKKSLGNCDIRRVYQAHLDERSREFRQTMIISSCRIEDLNSLFRNHTYNIRGFVRLWNLVEKEPWFLEKSLAVNKAQKLVPGIQQMFINTGTSNSPDESMLDYLSSHLYPNILAAVDGTTERILLVLSNYVSYLRVKKYLLQQNAVFASCHESSSNSSLSRNRLAFYKGELPILITTERFLFFRRYLIKGATKVIFGAPPIYPSIYLDCINSINYSQGPKNKAETKSNSISSLKSPPFAITLFHLQNSLALERIVGTSKCSNIIQNSKLFKPIVIKSSERVKTGTSNM